MKRSHAWHHTAFGNVACWLGSIQFAVPILIFVAVALGWGTYLESTQSARVAKSVVYGSMWFLILMGLVCVSLIFAVVTRYPWKRKHVGFIIVHASLIALIVGGFWSMWGRIEGHIGLDQGSTTGTLEMDQERLELVEHDNGQFRTLGEMEAPQQPGRYSIGGMPFEVSEVWENVREDFEVKDDGADPYRAVGIQFGPMAESAMWIGDETKAEAPTVDGMKIRVLADGLDWTPPTASNGTSPAATPESGYFFLVNDKPVPLGGEGQPAFPGWTIVGIKRFAHATVSGSGLSEEPGEKDNPAIEVTITDGKGTTEVHTAFEKFPDMLWSKPIEGTAKSGARLVAMHGAGGATPPAASGAGEELLVVFGKLPGIKVGHVGRDGVAKVLEHDGTFPWTADFGARKVIILRQFAKAREESKFVRAPAAEGTRPALVLRLGDSAEPRVLAWKAMVPVSLPGRVAMLRFHPRTVTLPFALRLDQFRKTDYPGTEMAMAYESDVTVQPMEGAERRATISMNNPLVQSGWKVYQSGFVGANVSIFSVMRDPGLPLTYIASVGLCLGILITFYGRGLTWGHPGVPAPFSGKEHSHATVPVRSDPVNGASVNGVRGHDAELDAETGSSADPGRRQSDAPGHVRA
ncbi:MAG TPA: cytochrome c biogenesis protein ResB [Phycisphaerales bacterium]|nr:cytochrome c biogenesis protein ResB [Phycisphaerales bacterium]